MRDSPRVVIDLTLQNLQTELIKRGRVLQKLLKAAYPGANAVLKAISSIHNLLYHEGRIYRPYQGRQHSQVHHEPKGSCGEYIIHVLCLYCI